jgi:pumilio homology domain family member 6
MDCISDDIITMSKNHYGHHVVVKVLKYGSKEMRKHTLKQFNGKVVKLCKHRDASEVLEYLFAEIADKTEQLSLLEEFWSPEFGIIKSKIPRKLDDILATEPERRLSVIKYLQETILALLNRKDTAKAAAFTHSIVHEPILKYLQLAAPKERSEMITFLAEHVARFLHTKAGSLAGVLCVGYGAAKDRKTITRSFKGYVDRICREENGHVVLLKLLDATDDTVLTGKSIYSEMKKNLLEIANDKNGRLSLLLLLCPGKRYFPVATLEQLKVFEVPDAEDAAKMVPTSKKDTDKRRTELLESIWDETKEMVLHRAFSLITNVYGRDVLVEAIKHAEGEARNEMLAAVLELCDYDPEQFSKTNKYSSGEKKKFHALDFLREEEPTKEDVLIHSLGHRTVRRLITEGMYLLLSPRLS